MGLLWFKLRSVAAGLMGVALILSSAPTTVRADDTIGLSPARYIGTERVQVHPRTDDEAVAYDRALALALDNRQDLGYPWVDPDSGELRIAVSTGRGETLGRGLIAAGDNGRIPAVVVQARASVAELDRISDALTRLYGKVAGANLIARTGPDQQTNRVLVTLRRADDTLVNALVARFGADMLEFRIDNRQSPSPSGRMWDAPAFWGGAYFIGPDRECTTGFAWDFGGGVSGMITAGHCIPNGGWMRYPGYANAGWVTQNSRESWDRTYGTQLISGQSVYRGDVAAIQYGVYGSAGKIYVGPADSYSSVAVAAMKATRVVAGDQVCFSGKTSGELCGFEVDAVGQNVNYLLGNDGGPNVWARNVASASRWGNACADHGDSGGPIFQYRGDGKVTAFGIQSGFLPLGFACEIDFTDIWDAWYAFPGTFKYA